MSVKIAIAGFGKLGAGVLNAVRSSDVLEPLCIVTRRDPCSVSAPDCIPVISFNDVLSLKGKVDVIILCFGSQGDLPYLSPMLAENFNIVDSFDDHAKIPEHFDRVNEAAYESGHTAIISAGWDPGIFSLARAAYRAFMPKGEYLTIWGPGVSQGHSNALRNIPGVADAKQYTVPISSAARDFISGKHFSDPAHECHRRECYVVAKKGFDRANIEKRIKEMPDYFEGYDTSVTFVSKEELDARHNGFPHAGRVIGRGRTADGSLQTADLALSLESNPAFTGSVLVAYARAAVKIYNEGRAGCFTPLDIPVAYFSELSPNEQRKKFL